MKYFNWKELVESVNSMNREDALSFCEGCMMEYDMKDEYNNEENRDTVVALRAYVEDNID